MMFGHILPQHTVFQANSIHPIRAPEVTALCGFWCPKTLEVDSHLF